MLFSEPRLKVVNADGVPIKQKVLVGLSLNEKGHPLYFKMEVVPDVKVKTLLSLPTTTYLSWFHHQQQCLQILPSSCRNDVSA